MSRKSFPGDSELLTELLEKSHDGVPSHHSKRITTIAASLLAAYKQAKSSTNPFRTLSAPIDRVVGPSMRPGYGIQISSPPGCYVEQLLLGLIKSVTSAGKEVAVVDCQNKLKQHNISRFLDGDERRKKIFYQSCHNVEDLIGITDTMPEFLSSNSEISVLIFSSLSFPLQLELNYLKRRSLIERVREFIIKICKQYNILVVVTSNMSTHFLNSDGSRGTFDHHNARGTMEPQLDLTCKSISSLIISRTSKTSGRARFMPATGQEDVVAEFDYDGLYFKEKP